jgi:hypothetical protein
MTNLEGTKITRGVVLAADFRDNLIIDRYDPAFVSMRGSKRAYLHSENSEDVLTWNVFRSLRQVRPSIWVPSLAERGLKQTLMAADHEVTLELWRTVPPPHSIGRHQKDEGDSEIDVVIETPDWVWFIEAKFRSDISLRTTSNETRDQVLRNLDVGSYWAGARDFYFCLLVLDRTRSEGARRLLGYTVDDYNFAAVLSHRPRGLANLRGSGILEWSDLATTLQHASSTTPSEDERGYAQRAVQWLAQKGITAPSGDAA